MFSDRLRELRKAKKITQEELAVLFGVERSTIGKWESKNIIPSADMLVVISNFFNVSIDYLLGKSDNKTNGLSDDPEIDEILEALHKRPEMKILFSKTRRATKEDVEKAVRIIEALNYNK